MADAPRANQKEKNGAAAGSGNSEEGAWLPLSMQPAPAARPGQHAPCLQGLALVEHCIIGEASSW